MGNFHIEGQAPSEHGHFDLSLEKNFLHMDMLGHGLDGKCGA